MAAKAGTQSVADLEEAELTPPTLANGMTPSLTVIPNMR